MTDLMSKKQVIRDLGGGLVLRHAAPADTEELATFNGLMHTGPNATEPDENIAEWTRDLMQKEHPTFRIEDFLLVEDTTKGTIVSTSSLISQVWSYAGVPFKLGRPELVATHPDYRGRGLVRVQFEELHKWSAERGEIAQAITGIPFYYRQFGYEMTLLMPSRRIGYKTHIPPLGEGAPEPYNIRSAGEGDIAFMVDLYDRAMKRYLVTVPRGEDIWRYEMLGTSAKSVAHKEYRVIETPEGEAVGFLAHAPWLWGPALDVSMFEVKPGVSWAKVIPSVLRYLGRMGAEYTERDKKSEFGAYMFSLGESHPVYDAVASKLPRRPPQYTYFMRVPDLGAFMRHIAPVLEDRLSGSSLAGYTGELKINFYRSTLRMAFEQGKLTVAEPYKPEHQEDGHSFFPGLTFLHVLFGHLELEEIERVYCDCYTHLDTERLLLKTLFPRQPSLAIAVS
jgi:GNAT superfamily N-acetyltransferase